MASSIFQVRTANECIRDARNIPIPQMLFDELWFEREVTILFAAGNPLKDSACRRYRKAFCTATLR